MKPGQITLVLAATAAVILILVVFVTNPRSYNKGGSFTPDRQSYDDQARAPEAISPNYQYLDLGELRSLPESQSGEQIITDSSGRETTLVAQQESLRLTNPVWRDVWELEETRTIRWSQSNQTGSVRILIFPSPFLICGFEDVRCSRFFRSQITPWVIAEKHPNTGSFKWRVGAHENANELLEPAKYTILIENLDTGTWGESETFALTEKGDSKSIETVVPYDPDNMPYPANPQTYWQEYGILHGILWKSSPSIFYVDIFIRAKSCGSSCTLGSGLYLIAKRKVNDGVFGWDPAKDFGGRSIPKGDFELFVVDSEDSTVKSNIRPFILK